jgi:hypothetical protein
MPVSEAPLQKGGQGTKADERRAAQSPQFLKYGYLCWQIQSKDLTNQRGYVCQGLVLLMVYIWLIFQEGEQLTMEQLQWPGKPSPTTVIVL